MPQYTQLSLVWCQVSLQAHDVSRRRAHTPPWKALRLQVSTGCCWPGLANSWVILMGILHELMEDTEDAHEGMSTGDPHQTGFGMRHCCSIPSPCTMQGWRQPSRYRLCFGEWINSFAVWGYEALGFL